METGVTAVPRLDSICHSVRVRPVAIVALARKLIDILMAAVTAFMGVWIASCGVIGFMFGPLSALTRLLFFVAGILLLLPADALPHGLAINGIGLVLGILLLSKDYIAKRPEAPQPTVGGGGE